MAVLSPAERDWVIGLGSAYLSHGDGAVLKLPLTTSEAKPRLALTRVPLPEWASELGVGAPPALVVDPACCVPGEGPLWRRCDWLRAAYLHAWGWLERAVERRRGPLHSYAYRLPSSAQPAYDRAWVNRIFLFLRRWAARDFETTEERLFGALPKARIELTHDLDYVSKTLPLRIKNGGFAGINVVRGLLPGKRHAPRALAAAVRLACGSGNYDRIDDVCGLEERCGRRSLWHVYGGSTGLRGGFVSWLLDPGYDVADSKLAARLRGMVEAGWEVGLHQAFASWRSPSGMRRERCHLENAVGRPVRRCRQHWLRFSWTETWPAQAAAGLACDGTLGFNDRPGFRNGCALRFQPWDAEVGRPLGLTAIPMVVMDSQLFAYAGLDAESALAEAARWIEEVRAVGGEASINWHPHGFAPDFGWGRTYAELLEIAP